ncbi:hypothetical protein K3X13_04255 [Aliiroseovarius crassostreae]|uniref:hypothetical protein n=1 Tax=Aliiroseovarius crassostreae TaxID=154981 RepID=UPI00220513F7|nr:hypothetical protein [Aliiroseovarius crassostreae]UWP93063.1 hypothetical protein K3X13_04255 [Aliiroseovarius crassostreae]
MASDKMRTENKFNYGDVVQVVGSSPEHLHHGKTLGSICGVDLILTENRMNELEAPIETFVYLVEFEDGDTIEIAERFLRLYSVE